MSQISFKSTRTKGYIQLKILVVRAQAACLTSRMGNLGVGAREAAARRTVAMAQETKLQREEEAHFSAYDWGRGGWSGRR